MKEETDRLVLDVGDHKYLPRIAPHYLKWRAQYGMSCAYYPLLKIHSSFSFLFDTFVRLPVEVEATVS